MLQLANNVLPGATGGGGLLESGIPGIDPPAEKIMTMIFKKQAASKWKIGL